MFLRYDYSICTSLLVSLQFLEMTQSFHLLNVAVELLNHMLNWMDLCQMHDLLQMLWKIVHGLLHFLLLYWHGVIIKSFSGQNEYAAITLQLPHSHLEKKKCPKWAQNCLFWVIFTCHYSKAVWLTKNLNEIKFTHYEKIFSHIKQKFSHFEKGLKINNIFLSHWDYHYFHRDTSH